jgi:hypothetical protein
MLTVVLAVMYAVPGAGVGTGTTAVTTTTEAVVPIAGVVAGAAEGGVPGKEKTLNKPSPSTQSIARPLITLTRAATIIILVATELSFQTCTSSSFLEYVRWPSE